MHEAVESKTAEELIFLKRKYQSNTDTYVVPMTIDRRIRYALSLRPTFDRQTVTDYQTTIHSG